MKQMRGYLTAALSDPAGPLPKLCNAGLVDMEWIISLAGKDRVEVIPQPGSKRGSPFTGLPLFGKINNEVST
jgi:hypothetical protein